MQKFHRFTTFLNIQPGEGRLISLLVLLSFVLELAFVLIQSMAFGVFITEYGPQSLPYSYIAIAIFASLAAVLYIKLGERVSFSTALRLNLVFLGAFSTFVWLGLQSSFSHYVSFVLPLLFQIVLNLGTLVIWQLAGRLFTLQQAKRLFPLINAGGWLANVIGGLLVLPLVVGMGAINLLIPSIIFIGFAILTLNTITRAYPIQETPAPLARRKTGRSKLSKRFLQDRYVLLIFAFIMLWWIAFFILDNIFADRSAAQFPDVNQLTAFRGQLLAITAMVALSFSIFLTSRIIRRFGIRAGLLGEAVPVIFIVGLLAISGTLGGTLIVMFALATFAKLINVALGFSVSQSAYLMLYQPLPNTERTHTQAMAEGVFQPIASGVAGIGLLALTAGLKFSYLELSYVYVVLGIGLLAVILVLSRSYFTALTQAITKHHLGEFPQVLADAASISLLQSRLRDPHPDVVLYALNKLDTLDSRIVLNALQDLIQHPAPAVRREAFSRIEVFRLRTMLEAVNKQLILEREPLVKETALRALGAIADADSCSPLLNALPETDNFSRRGALIGLLKYQESVSAEEILHRLIDSSAADDRVLAAQVLGDADRTRFGQMHKILLRDPNPVVRREAIQSVAKSRQPLLYPLLIEACDSPETSHAASLALIAIGTEIFPEVRAAFSQLDAPRSRLLVLPKVIARIGGAHSHALLRSRMNSSESELRTQILSALSECGYRTKDQSEILAAIKMEIGWCAWVCAAQVDLGNTKATGLLSAGLRQFIAQARERVLLLLSFGFDAHSMLRVREAEFTGSLSKSSYALEIIETQLPPDWKPMILPLFEDLSSHEQLQRLALIFPQTQQPVEDRLRALIGGLESQRFTEWIRACAIHAAVQRKAQSTYELIQGTADDGSMLIGDTARWALVQFSTEQQKGKTTMLPLIEKVLILKTVNMFSQTPDDVLADVANLLEEMEVAENQTIFKKGDPGDSMYIIVDGKVRVHTGGRLLNYLGESDVFGEMAMLDPEPRVASVTTVESTRLFRLDQSPFYQLMTERPEVATGIIRVLTKLLRDRVRDLSQLESRVNELERSLTGNEPVSA